MDEGVIARGEFAEILEQRVRIAGAHQLDEVIDDVFQPLGQFPGDVPE